MHILVFVNICIYTAKHLCKSKRVRSECNRAGGSERERGREREREGGREEREQRCGAGRGEERRMRHSCPGALASTSSGGRRSNERNASSRAQCASALQSLHTRNRSTARLEGEAMEFWNIQLNYPQGSGTLPEQRFKVSRWAQDFVRMQTAKMPPALIGIPPISDV